MATYTIMTSNHPRACKATVAKEYDWQAVASWQTRYDGPIASDEDARDTAEQMAKFYRFVRVFKHSREDGGLMLELQG